MRIECLETEKKSEEKLGKFESEMDRMKVEIDKLKKQIETADLENGISKQVCIPMKQRRR